MTVTVFSELAGADTKRVYFCTIASDFKRHLARPPWRTPGRGVVEAPVDSLTSRLPVWTERCGISSTETKKKKRKKSKTCKCLKANPAVEAGRLLSRHFFSFTARQIMGRDLGNLSCRWKHNSHLSPLPRPQTPRTPPGPFTWSQGEVFPGPHNKVSESEARVKPRVQSRAPGRSSCVLTECSVVWPLGISCDLASD